MKQRLVALLLVATGLAAPTLALAQTADRATLEYDVRTLASDAMEGREAGTRGYQMAADYIARRFADIGLQLADIVLVEFLV